MGSIYHMKSIYKKIDISYTLLFVIFLSFISGLFKDIIILFMVIVIHEMGHIFTSKLFEWRIDKISIGVAGGYITYDEVIDKPFKEEFLIALSGFLFQLILFIVSLFLYKNNLIDYKIYFLIKKYNISIFIFNLIPIYPLDGAKLLNTIFNMFLPYKKSLKITNLLSVMFIFFILLYFLYFNNRFELSYIMIFSFLIKKLIAHIKDIPYLFNRFLFERYNKPIKAKKYVIIKGNNIDKFKRQKKHIFLLKNKQYTEKSILSKRFD